MINSERLLQTFLELAQIDSPTGDEEKMAQESLGRLKGFGLNPFIDQYFNVISQIPGNKNYEPIILNAHLDTVKPGVNIKPLITDGLIHSNGKTIAGIDDKVGIAAILETIETLHGTNYSNNRPLDVVFTVHEESKTDGPRLLDYSKIRTKRGYSFDGAQPVGTISLASPFYNRFDFLVSGKEAHSSRPDQALNALSLTLDALSRVKAGQLDDDSVRNIRIADAQIQSDKNAPFGLDVSVNKITGSMVGMGEVRSFVEKKVESYTEDVKTAFMSAISDSEEPYKLDFRSVRENGGFKYEQTDPFVQETVRIIEKLGIKPEFFYGFSCYDANVFAEMGVQIINCCLGSEFHHTTREKITVENFNRLGNLVYALATDLG